MKKHFLLRMVFLFGMVAIPWVYLGSIWKDLPATVAVHFGIDGKPDRYGPKGEMLIAPLAFTFASILMYFLLTNIHKLDPKRTKKDQSTVFLKIANALVVFLTCICLLTLNWALKSQTTSLNFLLVLLGIFFAYMGNLMHSVKPNYFVGMRLPWTLESENNWRATHLLMSKVWFAGGILISVLALFIKAFPMFFVMMGVLLVMIIIPVIYSFRYYRKEKLQQLQ